MITLVYLDENGNKIRINAWNVTFDFEKRRIFYKDLDGVLCEDMIGNLKSVKVY